jgi:malonyl-CoA O-methyltransferase
MSALMRELRAIGATNALRSRRHTLTGRARFAAAAQAYETFRTDDGAGTLPATWEVITAMAWAPGPGAPIREGGFDVTSVPIAAIPVRRRR